MGENTKIEWADNTFNGWIGCTRVSPGCENCYAAEMAARFNMAEWGVGKKRMLTSDANWKKPLAWNARAARRMKRETVFCSSLADVFDNEVPYEYRRRLWELVRATPNLDWLLLTKRIGNAKDMLPDDWGNGFPNVWIGATIVNQEEADRDIPKLLATPARVRFLSMEPLLSGVDIERYLRRMLVRSNEELTDKMVEQGWSFAGGIGDHPPVDWVIAGGESGKDARPMNPDWARSLRDQCTAAGVPFFFKQWGTWRPAKAGDLEAGKKYTAHIFPGNSEPSILLGKKKAGRSLDGLEHNAFPVRHDNFQKNRGELDV